MAYRMRARIFGSIVVKILYISNNMLAFLALDFLLHHEYMEYGVKWVKWVGLPNHIAYDYMGTFETVQSNFCFLFYVLIQSTVENFIQLYNRLSDGGTLTLSKFKLSKVSLCIILGKYKEWWAAIVHIY